MLKMAASLAMVRVYLAEPCSGAAVHLPFARRLHTVQRRFMLSSSQASFSSLSTSSVGSGSLQSVGFRRPDEIPWQRDLVNSVTLIGHVNHSIDLKYCDSGKIMASTSLRVKHNAYLQKSRSETVFFVQFWDELAEIAAAHLKKEDRVYIAGSVWVESFLDKENIARSACKVVARDLKFVGNDYRGHSNMKTGEEHGEETSVYTFERKSRVEELWRDYFKEPSAFWDNRVGKVKEGLPDFKHRSSGAALWISNKDTPSWVHARLGEVSNEQNKGKGEQFRVVEKLWQRFFSDPTEWWDNRSTKASKNSPDFKNKLTGEALWIESSYLPSWVKSQLDILESKAKSLVEAGTKGNMAGEIKHKTPKTGFEDEDFNFL